MQKQSDFHYVNRKHRKFPTARMYCDASLEFNRINTAVQVLCTHQLAHNDSIYILQVLN